MTNREQQLSPIPTPRELLTRSLDAREENFEDLRERGEQVTLSALHRYLSDASNAGAERERVRSAITSIIAEHEANDILASEDLDELVYMLSIRLKFASFDGFANDALIPIKAWLERAQERFDSVVGGSDDRHTQELFFTTYAQLASVVFEHSREVDRERILEHVAILRTFIKENGRELFEVGAFSKIQQAANRLGGVANLALTAPAEEAGDTTPESVPRSLVSSRTPESSSPGRSAVRIGGVKASIWSRGANLARQRSLVGGDTHTPKTFHDFEHSLFEMNDGSFQVSLVLIEQDGMVLVRYKPTGTYPEGLEELTGRLTLEFANEENNFSKTFEGDIKLDLRATPGEHHGIPGKDFRVFFALQDGGESLDSVVTTFVFELLESSDS